MKKARKHYTAEEKVAILRRHLVDKEPVSKLCDELALQPTVFYRWQKEFFENGPPAFQNKNRSRRQPEQERIERLQKKIQTKDEVLAELMAEHIALKKSLGERVAPRIVRVGYPFDSGSHKMLWSRESIYQEANPEVTALARRGAA